MVLGTSGDFFKPLAFLFKGLLIGSCRCSGWLVSCVLFILVLQG